MNEPSGGPARLAGAEPGTILRDDPTADATVRPDDPSVLDRRTGVGTPESSAVVAERICDAWQRQRRRQGVPNAELPIRAAVAADSFAAPALGRLELSGRTFGLSVRRIHGTARVARTIADLEGAERVEDHHVREALQYRAANAA